MHEAVTLQTYVFLLSDALSESVETDYHKRNPSDLGGVSKVVRLVVGKFLQISKIIEV